MTVTLQFTHDETGNPRIIIHHKDGRWRVRLGHEAVKMGH